MIKLTGTCTGGLLVFKINILKFLWLWHCHIWFCCNCTCTSREYPDFCKYALNSYFISWIATIFLFYVYHICLNNYNSSCIVTLLLGKMNIQKLMVMLHVLLVFSVSIFWWVESLFLLFLQLKTVLWVLKKLKWYKKPLVWE